MFCLEGTRIFAPPEWVRESKYKAESSTVWQLGILLYCMLFRNPPFGINRRHIGAKLPMPRGVSDACRDIISRCLHMNALERSTLVELSSHSWIAPTMEAQKEAAMCTVTPVATSVSRVTVACVCCDKQFNGLCGTCWSCFCRRGSPHCAAAWRTLPAVPSSLRVTPCVCCGKVFNGLCGTCWQRKRCAKCYGFPCTCSGV